MNLIRVVFLVKNCHLNYYFYLMEIEHSEELAAHLILVSHI